MRNNSKTKAAVLFSMLFAVVFSFAVFTAPVSAADSAKAGVTEGPKTVYLKALETSGLNENNRGGSTHADPATFEKNFCLSAAQKEYTITEIERVVARILKPGMSDLEKYYRLAVWENKRAKYDWEFWDGDYNFELYRHQWDSFGVLTEKSVCVGMAITYAALCHAADLPCKFVRTDPSLVDHTMNYIPDINGHAYYADITENDSRFGRLILVVDKTQLRTIILRVNAYDIKQEVGQIISNDGFVLRLLDALGDIGICCLELGRGPYHERHPHLIIDYRA